MRHYRFYFAIADACFGLLLFVVIGGLALFGLFSYLIDALELSLNSDIAAILALGLTFWFARIAATEEFASIRARYQPTDKPEKEAPVAPGTTPAFDQHFKKLPPEGQQRLLAETHYIQSIADGVTLGKRIEWDMKTHHETAAEILKQPVLHYADTLIKPTVFTDSNVKENAPDPLEVKFDAALRDLETDLSGHRQQRRS